MAFAKSETNLSEDNVEQKRRITNNLEAALDSIGYGKFQWQITLVSGFAYIACGMQTGLNSYLIPAASCDLKMDSARMGTLNSVFLAGSVFSTYLWGLCADLAGRKRILLWTLILDGILTFASSFVQHFEVFCLFRFCAGFLVASPCGIFFPYLGEFHSIKDSPRSVCILGFFFTLSWLILPGVSWLILPIKWSYHSPDGSFIYNSWRILVLVTSLPLLISAGLLIFEPETPKYLVSQGKFKEAEKVLKKMQLMNFGKKSIQALPELRLTDEKEETVQEKEQESPNDKLISVEKSQALKRLLRAMWLQTKTLFMPPLLNLTILFALLIFCNMVGFYGLGFWLPELFNRLEEHYSTTPNVTVTVCELSKMVKDSKMESNLPGELASCLRNEPINPQMFVNTVVMGAVCVLANMLSVFLSKRLEYRIIPVSMSFLSGVCVLAIYLLRSSTGNLAASSLFQASITTSNYAMTSVIVDLFPTTVRGVGLSVGLLAGRISSVFANLLMGQLLEFNCHLLFGLIIAILISGGILCIFIPKNNTKS